MKQFYAFQGLGQHLRLPAGATSVVATLGWAVAIGVAYFAAARLGLALLAESSGVAVFWPAAGIAAGVLITAGRRAIAPVVIGVLVGAVAANLMSDRGLWAAIPKGFCSAGEAVLMAWLLERWFGRAFAFNSLRQVGGFLAAAGLATATSAVGGAATLSLFDNAPSYWAAWGAWALSAGIGILVVAPLVIGIGQLLRKPPSRREWIEGVAGLGVLALTSVYVVTGPTTSWVSFCLGAFVLPPLLWLAARCPPTFAIAGAFVASIAVICATIFGIGHFGDAAIALVDRVKGAQAAVLMVSAYTLVLLALLTERRLRAKRLHRLLGALPAAVYTTDKAGRITFCNKEAVDLWGVTPKLGKDKWIDCWRLYYPDGTLIPLHERPLQICLQEGRAVRDREAILERLDGTRVPIIPCPAPLFDEQGDVVGVVNMQLNLTERKQAEAALAERNAQLELASRAARVGSFTIDFATSVIQLSPGYATVFGRPAGTVQMSREEARTQIHPEDLAGLDTLLNQAFLERRRELVAQFRIVRADNGETRWIESRGHLSYDKDGRPSRLMGVGIDVTERKQAEDHKSLLIAELDHRVKNALACVDAMVSQSRANSKSMDEFIGVLSARIQSLANTHTLLSLSRWRGVGLAELVRSELAPCMGDGNTLVEGPAIDLTANSVQAVAIVLHELATNAAKYGALSNDTGQVSVRWNWQANGSSPRGLALEWRETGGPPVVAPAQPGYGMSVIRDVIPYELGGTVDYALAGEGARCVVQIPAAWICTPDAPLDLVNEAVGQSQPSPSPVLSH